MSTHDVLRSWLTDAADSAIELAARHEISEGADRFRTAIETAAAIPYEPQMLPVLRNLSRVTNSERALKFAELAPSLRWIPSHRWDDEGQDRALCVLSDMFDMPGIEAGIMYVDQGCTYPLHNHPPQELYLTVSGTARWRFGGAEELVEMQPNMTLYNRPSDFHTVEAGETPLVAMYILWGAGVRS
ncbi:MAG: hypothetical protein CL458_03505 [Acidimicrobiaceae bacterium]|nr:hypothetical protein [Acidimicrobiaceae bacterium]